MLIKRNILQLIQEALQKEPRIIILYGPRQAGKTTLLQQLRLNYHHASLYLNGDDLRTQEILSIHNLDHLKKIVGIHQLVVIDEAQRIENIGLTLKLLYDNLHIRLIASGSSSLDLANKINEPLTGRTLTFTLYPLSVTEISAMIPDMKYSYPLEDFLRFGLYPKTVTVKTEADKQSYLYELLNGYLYKDILTFEQIRKPKKVIDLLSLLALQIGTEVAISELAKNLAISKIIVEKYLDFLEKMFVIINLRGFSRNLRKEISKTSKYFFVDLGLRNALIRNFNPLGLRNDAGFLWENFCIIERMKKLFNIHDYANFYFWRTYDQKEIDLIEEQKGKILAYEFKWNPKAKIKSSAQKEFLRTYIPSEFQLILPNNLTQFLSR